MMITAQLRPPSPGASMLPPHVKSVGDRARAGPDRHIRRMMSYGMNLRECATGYNPLARSSSAVGGADLDARFGGGGRAFLGGERIDDQDDEGLEDQLAQLADHDGRGLPYAVAVGRGQSRGGHRIDVLACERGQAGEQGRVIG